MAEEKKEEKKEPAGEEQKPKAEEPKKEEPKPAQGLPVTEAPKAGAEAPAAAATPAKEEKKPEAKKERPANCAVCNKLIRKKRCYYRNGKYYCTKRCWQTSLKKEEKPAEPKT